jgi:hypothetical protein
MPVRGRVVMAYDIIDRDSRDRQGLLLYGDQLLLTYQFYVYLRIRYYVRRDKRKGQKGIKGKAEELGINIRDVVEKALEKAIEEKEKEDLKKLASDIKELMKGVSEEEWVEAIRRSRDER